VLTYNIHHCNPPSIPDTIDVEAIARVINEAQPDLVALQEVDVHTERSGKQLDQAKALAGLTSMHVYFRESIPYRGGSYGLAILSKFPILEKEGYDLPAMEGIASEPRSLVMITVQLAGGQKLKFGSTHLDYTDAATNLLQAQAIAKLCEGEPLPLIIAGDFNAEPQSESIALLDQHFARTCQEACAGTVPVQMPVKTIDFILYRPDALFKVKQHKVIPETYASDHRPVMATFGIED
jgi:endonuclease/exonuclease/phosphatase family metal-dependent hydrolase